MRPILDFFSFHLKNYTLIIIVSLYIYHVFFIFMTRGYVFFLDEHSLYTGGRKEKKRKENRKNKTKFQWCRFSDTQVGVD